MKSKSKEELISAFNLDISDKADVIERLFCASIINEDVTISSRILNRYRKWRDIIYSNANPQDFPSKQT